MAKWKLEDQGRGLSVVEAADDDPAALTPEDALSPRPDVEAGDITVVGEDADATVEVDADYNPADHNIADVKKYVGDSASRRAAVLKAETGKDGKNRSGLVTWLSPSE